MIKAGYAGEFAVLGNFKLWARSFIVNDVQIMADLHGLEGDNHGPFAVYDRGTRGKTVVFDMRSEGHLSQVDVYYLIGKKRYDANVKLVSVTQTAQGQLCYVEALWTESEEDEEEPTRKVFRADKDSPLRRLSVGS
jgi:hypothetical protein